MLSYKQKRGIKEIIEAIISIGISFFTAFLAVSSKTSMGIWYAVFAVAMGILGVCEIILAIRDFNN